MPPAVAVKLLGRWLGGAQEALAAQLSKRHPDPIAGIQAPVIKLEGKSWDAILRGCGLLAASSMWLEQELRM